MRIGILGPTDDARVLREACEFLLGEAEVDRAIYLGTNDAVDRVVSVWSAEMMGDGDADNTERAFLNQAVRLALEGSGPEIRALLQADAQLHRLRALHRLPPPPVRAIEMIEDRIVIAVHDKAVLDEEDIANAHVIVYGKSTEPVFKRFGPRCFFSPGPLEDGKLGILEVHGDGRTTVGLYDPSGAPLWKEALQGRTAKIMVSG